VRTRKKDSGGKQVRLEGGELIVKPMDGLTVGSRVLLKALFKH
jgi:hypothetical protein